MPTPVGSSTTRMLTSLLAPFAKSIFAKCAALSDVTLDLKPSQRARLREAICDDIKKCSNFVVPEVSEAALKEALALEIDLFSKDWHDQPAFDAGREVFHFEHVQPVSVIRDICLKSASEAEIQGVLEQKLRVAWILKAEDAELTRLGFRSKRDNPDAAYSQAGIRLQKQQAAINRTTTEPSK